MDNKNFMKDAKEPLVGAGANPAGDYEDAKPQIEYNEEGLSSQEAVRLGSPKISNGSSDSLIIHEDYH